MGGCFPLVGDSSPQTDNRAGAAPPDYFSPSPLPLDPAARIVCGGWCGDNRTKSLVPRRFRDDSLARLETTNGGRRLRRTIAPRDTADRSRAPRS